MSLGFLSNISMDRIGRILTSLLIAVPFLLHSAQLIRIPFIDTLENIAYDVRLNLTLPGTVDERIVIVDVDEKSLANEGRFPWPRDKLARLIDQLFERYGIAIIGFDMVFAEADDSVVLRKLDEILSTRPDSPVAREIQTAFPARDESFGQSLAGRPVVLGYYFSYNANDSPTTGVLPEPILPAEIAEALEISALAAHGYGANLEVLQRVAKRGGYFDNPLSDDDGIFRRAPMVQSYQSAIYDSLSLAMTQAYLGETLVFGKNKEWLYLGDRGFPVDENQAVLIPYRGRQGSFHYVSATDVLSENIADPQILKDKIVLLGTSAPGLFDLRNTPVQKIYPGVEIHANMISGMLDQRFLSKPAYTSAAALLTMALITVVMAFLMPIFGAITSILMTMSIMATLVGLNLYLWTVETAVLPLAGSIVLVLLLYLFNASYGFLVESSNKRALTKRFGQYVPPELVEEMARNPKKYSLHGERREMTVLFSDVRGFTKVSEDMEPEELSQLMNELLTTITQVIQQYVGTIDKYMGDAVMAFWGAPLDDPEHARHAVQAALNIQQDMVELRKRFADRGWPEIRVGIGLNTGTMNVGDMGSEFRMAYTVMGDAVNVGSRLEGLTKIYGVGIAVSETTAQSAPEFTYRELDRVRVKGRDTPLTLYEPFPARENLDPALDSELAGYKIALEMYRGQEWDGAEVEFRKLAESSGGHALYERYLAQISHFRDEPPESDWDGVFTHETK
jgi:adenylate cyclase